ncbi:hypothetical protein JCM30566_04720 [Marinitoga arctica]
MLKDNLYGIIEIPIIIVLLFIIDISLRYFGYIFINPNPYFLFIIFVAIRYGINYSLVAGGLSSFFMFLSLYFNVKEDFFKVAVSWEVLKIPLSMLVFGIVVGFFRDMYVQKINIQKDQISLLKNKINSLEEEVRMLKNVTTDLEHKLVLEKNGVSLLIDKLREIEYDNAEDIFNEAIDLISDFISAKSVSIYVLGENDFLRLKVRKGPQFLPNSMPLNKSTVISMAKEFGSANINVLYLTDIEYDFEYEPAMAVSIKSGKRIIGFIVVEIIDPEKMNKNTEIYLRILSDWLSSLLVASEEIENKSIVMDEYERFNKILKEVDERHKKFNIPFSVIRCSYNGNLDINLLKSIIRDTDFLFIKEKEFNIILTSSSETGLERVLKKIKEIPGIKILEAYTKK